MADTNTTVHIGENSPEQVAFNLLHEVMRAEGKSLTRGDLNPGWTTADRKYLLDSFSECLQAVRGYR